MKLILTIQQAAARMQNVCVDVVEAKGRITIKDLTRKHDDIFLQGDDASEFISIAQYAWCSCGDVTMQQCYEWQAEQYVDGLWN